MNSSRNNEFTCNYTHENYKCQIQLLYDHLIHSCMLPSERNIPFTKPDTKQLRNTAERNEHVSKEFDHALHWHRLYLMIFINSQTSVKQSVKTMLFTQQYGC